MGHLDYAGVIRELVGEGRVDQTERCVCGGIRYWHGAAPNGCDDCDDCDAFRPAQEDKEEPEYERVEDHFWCANLSRSTINGRCLSDGKHPRLYVLRPTTPAFEFGDMVMVSGQLGVVVGAPSNRLVPVIVQGEGVLEWVQERTVERKES
jgi:hypothetical protein